jgi:DNA-binding HxlR family transcriptional regulator
MKNKKIDNSDISHSNEKCPIRQVLNRLGDKWSILVIITLGEKGRMRFNELNQHIGDISQKMLTVTLRTLEADGLVQREIFAQIPPRVEYELTEVGKSLLPHIESLTNWAEEHMPQIMTTRELYAEKNLN